MDKILPQVSLSTWGFSSDFATTCFDLRCPFFRAIDIPNTSPKRPPFYVVKGRREVSKFQYSASSGQLTVHLLAAGGSNARAGKFLLLEGRNATLARKRREGSSFQLLACVQKRARRFSVVRHRSLGEVASKTFSLSHRSRSLHTKVTGFSNNDIPTTSRRQANSLTPQTETEYVAPVWTKIQR